ncbi:hypothetical protein HPB47_019971 [Ixodes persulcatus]|uniref:Uncharacterized protein n=1 Tax=Ixodes persulcatus TaxID=34615 RepID=A0AC60QGM5_IXOPE|nr:hypothetical protein HPB47_019971 [Ixodes persulcatus]
MQIRLAARMRSCGVFFRDTIAEEKNGLLQFPIVSQLDELKDIMFPARDAVDGVPRRLQESPPPPELPVFGTFFRALVPMATPADVGRAFVLFFCAVLNVVLTLDFILYPSLTPFRCDDPSLQAAYGKEVLNTPSFIAVLIAVATFTIAVLEWRPETTRATDDEPRQHIKFGIHRMQRSDDEETTNKSHVIKDYFCAGSPEVVSKAGLSFPSAHTAAACYTGTYIVGYVVRREDEVASKWIRVTLVAVLLTASHAVAVIRVLEGLHGWWDVLAGIDSEHVRQGSGAALNACECVYRGASDGDGAGSVPLKSEPSFVNFRVDSGVRRRASIRRC